MKTNGTGSLSRIATALFAGMLIGTAAGVPPAAAGGETRWSVKPLPGAGELADRMAGYYEPVAVTWEAKAPPYTLPLKLQKITNAGFTRKLPDLGSPEQAKRFEERLSRSGFAVLAPGGSDDVAAFYKNMKRRGLPIFVTSDSLLHLYHIQFDETLRSIEEREFFDDAKMISGVLQAEALALYRTTEGDLKEAAKLLLGYATVPAVLLGQADLGREAAAALKELSAWPEEPAWDQKAAFRRKYAELLAVIADEREEPPAWLLGQPVQLRKALARYRKAHAAESDADPEVPKSVKQEVQEELRLIAAHEGFTNSPLFAYKEDYSQYVPRGHYTRSKRLEQYFKALMWYGRMTFLIRGRTPEADGLVSEAEARIQTLAASILAGLMEAKLPDARTLAQAWDRLYAVTAYYVGLADDLTPYEYRLALRQAIGESVSGGALTDAKLFFELRKRLAAMRKPEIYGGLGKIVGSPTDIADERDLAKALTLTQGMRLMGQRYIPDSYMMGRLVYPTVGKFAGTGNPFTLVRTPGGPARGFPRGLDVMAVLGSKRARHWLGILGDDRYEGYDREIGALKQTFGAIDAAGWNRNMYWSWLYALESLLHEYGSGYPTFMQTEAWRDKQLPAALASWSQLRHDTILYAKQSYTMMVGSAPLPEKMVEGYVEPVPEFYARLLALTRMTRKGLGEFEVLDEGAAGRLESLEKILARLLDISKQELSGARLTENDYAFIRSFGSRLEAATAGLSEGTETTLVADVHTDSNSGQVLEEGTGSLHVMAAVYPMPDGGLVAGAGPVLSHYEFKHPLSDRLTDEAWREMLRSPGPPPLPPWTASFTVGAGQEGSSTAGPGRVVPGPFLPSER
jgi:hypothetical protein